MPFYKSYLLLSILSGSLSLQAQEINNATLAGEWIGYDNKDSVKAVRTVHLQKAIQPTIADTILTDRVSSDQLELNAGRGVNATSGVVFNLAPSTGSFYIDKLEVGKSQWLPVEKTEKDNDPRFSICITYWKDKTDEFFLD